MSKDFLELNRPLRMGFYGFWDGFEKYRPEFPVYGLFESVCPIEIVKNVFTDQCDVVLTSVFEPQHNWLKENRFTVQYIGEPQIFYKSNWCDYNIGFLPDDKDNLHFPIWMNDFVTYKNKTLSVTESPRPLTDKWMHCAVYASHDCCGLRTHLWDIMKPYGPIHSYGAWKNNQPSDNMRSATDIERAEAKCSMLDNYKYNICAENSIEPYYMTEKLPQALLSNCIPIYMGDPNIDQSPINMNKVIYGNNKSISDIVQRYEYVNSHYDEIVKEPLFTRTLFPNGVEERSERLFNRIMEEL